MNLLRCLSRCGQRDHQKLKKAVTVSVGHQKSGHAVTLHTLSTPSKKYQIPFRSIEWVLNGPCEIFRVIHAGEALINYEKGQKCGQKHVINLSPC